MNDFTKQELIMLKHSIQYLSDRTSLSDGYLEAHNAMENKIQSMIDNYCEHEIHEIIDGCQHSWLKVHPLNQKAQRYLCEHCCSEKVD